MVKNRIIIKTKDVNDEYGNFHKKDIPINGKNVSGLLNDSIISFSNIQKDGDKHSYIQGKNRFPLHVFPESIRNLIEEVNKIVGFPKDYFAGSILVAASVAIGNSVQFRVRDTQLESPTIYMSLVGAAGINKTHPLNYALRPLYKKDKEFYDCYLKEMQEYEIESQRLKDESKRKKSSIEKVKEPNLKQCVVSDITVEALMVIHSKNLRGLVYHKDELIGWINDFDKYRQGSDEQVWLSIFSGTPIKVDRKTGNNKHLQINKPCVSVIGTIQNDILYKLSAGAKGDNGFIDRIVFVMPEGLKKPVDFNNGKIPLSLSSNYENVIYKLLSLPYIEGEEKILTFSEGSIELFKSWHKNQAMKYNNLQDTDLKKRIYPKIEVYVARFAMILQLMHWASDSIKYSNQEIEPFIMQAAIDLGNYFFNMAIAVREKISNKGSYMGNENKIAAKVLNEKGWSTRKIGKAIGVSHVTVLNWLKE